MDWIGYNEHLRLPLTTLRLLPFTVWRMSSSLSHSRRWLAGLLLVLFTSHLYKNVKEDFPTTAFLESTSQVTLEKNERDNTLVVSLKLNPQSPA
jgi:hypothetical protein